MFEVLFIKCGIIWLFQEFPFAIQYSIICFWLLLNKFVLNIKGGEEGEVGKTRWGSIFMYKLSDKINKNVTR